jgi:hypothetical protein
MDARLAKQLGVPENLAHVVDGLQIADYELPSYILIQDVHRHAEVQNEIAAILLYGRRQWHLRDVFIEGAFDEVTRQSLLQRTSDSSLTAMVREGRLSGAEMAAATENGQDLRLLGMEDPDLYKANLRVYEAVEEKRSNALDELRTIRMLQAGLGLDSAKFDEDELDAMERLLRLKWRPADREHYSQRMHESLQSPALRDALQTAETFYATADARSHAFVKKIEARPAKGPRVLIVGGYHTPQMAEELRRKGISFVVLAPQVTQPANDDIVRERLQESISALKLQNP